VLGAGFPETIAGGTMKKLIALEQAQKEKLWSHLLPENPTCEKAAFIFADFTKLRNLATFIPREIYLATGQDFASQHTDYLELTDATRISLIKRAHKLDASIIELHSHSFPGSCAAAFSLADRKGLQEIVPQMWWRLKNKPYGAIVVAPEGFDALIWWDNPVKPEALDGITINGTILKPTNRSLKGW